MDVNTKLILRLALPALRIWRLAKFVAISPGGITIGKVQGKRAGCSGSGDWRSMRAGAGNLYSASGMGTELIATAGISSAPAGLPVVFIR